jgi:hypothetical protein
VDIVEVPDDDGSKSGGAENKEQERCELNPCQIVQQLMRHEVVNDQLNTIDSGYGTQFYQDQLKAIVCHTFKCNLPDVSLDTSSLVDPFVIKSLCSLIL